ncbi:MAG TPA: NAD(P)H-binding protein, partial [Longimicrobiales bacterium]
MSRVLVTGATGRIGREVVAGLLGAGAEVRGLTRDPPTARLPAGVEVVCGDLTLPESLEPALDGVDAIFLVWPAAGATAPAVVRRMAACAGRLVLLSSPYRTPHPFFQQPNALRALHQQLDELVTSSGAAWTILRPGMFASNALFW